MRLLSSRKKSSFKNTACLLIYVLLLSSCAQVKNIFTYPKKNQYPVNKPFLFETSIKLKGGKFDGDERSNLLQRLYTQLDDSSRVVINDKFFIFHPVMRPPVYDTSYSNRSAINLKNFFLHLGYYRTIATYTNDTSTRKYLKYSFPFKFRRELQKRVTVKYTVIAGVPTIVDTFSYRLQNNALQQLALQSAKKSYIVQSKPITKTDVLSEISRLTDTFRNNGYYKFTTENLIVRGDSSIASLTNISDDPVENIRLLAEASEKINKPSIRLGMFLNPAADSNGLKLYHINNIYIYPDYTSIDALGATTFNERKDSLGNIIRYHNEIIRKEILLRFNTLKKGDLYRRDDYAKTINNFSRLGVWQNINVQLKESSSGLLDVIVQLIPSKKYGLETNIEVSYSTNSNNNSFTLGNRGNVLGISGNVSLQNRNVWRRAVKMTHAFRAGVELNLNAPSGAGQLINANEISYINTISIPSTPAFINKLIDRKKRIASQQTFFNTSVAKTDRIGLFKLNSLAFSVGFEYMNKKNQRFTFKPLNVEYTNLYSRSEAFDAILKENPFLRYSFNTALVLGYSFGFTESHFSKKNSNIVITTKINAEQSGALFPFIPLANVSFLKKDLRQFVKFDIERTTTINYLKSSIALRYFVGFGAPVGNSDTTLPFFKQYFVGGPNSMRAWAVRGLGPGSKALAPYKSTTFVDRTGDIRVEANVEYRRTLFQIIPNSLALKWAVFVDVGNIWNARNTAPGLAYDSAQFKWSLHQFYKELGVAAGFGLRFDFNYVLLRLDFGLRFKRPELSENNGWKAPNISFDEIFAKLLKRDDEYRRWRYQNFNFSIGLSYPF